MLFSTFFEVLCLDHIFFDFIYCMLFLVILKYNIQIKYFWNFFLCMLFSLVWNSYTWIKYFWIFLGRNIFVLSKLFSLILKSYMRIKYYISYNIYQKNIHSIAVQTSAWSSAQQRWPSLCTPQPCRWCTCCLPHWACTLLRSGDHSGSWISRWVDSFLQGIPGTRGHLG